MEMHCDDRRNVTLREGKSGAIRTRTWQTWSTQASGTKEPTELHMEAEQSSEMTAVVAGHGYSVGEFKTVLRMIKSRKVGAQRNQGFDVIITYTKWIR